MQYLSLELKGFKRMKLNNVDTFSIRPTEPIQLILGTNGCGKSSLLGELTPLPPNPADYTKEGSKTITIAHRGDRYVLKSWFNPSQKHSFIKNDDEELNPGGTVTVQKEMVRQVFGVTPEIHELLLGLETFTSMSPARRREWFTQLSDVNYDYALQVFGRLKERSRDISGALKLAKKRLVAESAKLMTADDELRLKQEVQQLLDELDILQSQRAPVTTPVEQCQQDLNAGLAELTRLSMRLLRIRYVAPYAYYPPGSEERNEWGELHRPAFTSLDEIGEHINLIKHHIGVKEVLINKAAEEHTKLKDTVDVLIKTGQEGIKALLEKRHALVAHQKTLLAKRSLGIEQTDAISCLAALDTVHELLVSIFTALPENADRRFSQTRLQELQDRRLARKDARLKHHNQLLGLRSQKAHLETHRDAGETKCPKCNHVWVPGYSEEKFAEFLQQLEQVEQTIVNDDKAIAELDQQIAAIEEYASFYRDYVRCTRNWPVLQGLWDYITERNYVAQSPRMVLTAVDAYRHDLEYSLQAQQVAEEQRELEKLIASSEAIGDANLAESKEKLDEITVQIESLTSELQQLQRSHTEYKTYQRQLGEALALGEQIRTLKVNLTKANQEMVEMLRRETLNHCIRQLQSSLARKEESLSAIALQRGIVTDLEHQIDDLVVQEEAAKHLVKQLSPTDGLIAEGLLGFIRNFTGQMNSIIKKIWTYPLFIKDCGVSHEGGAELDYKFPLWVQHKGNEVTDISKGSSGMQEIINLAFKLVAMRYLGLAESPLILDEFGRTFDPAHRTAATEVIKSLMLQHPFTQLYLVSHYEASYGALTNAEICVICATNIAIPSTTQYNNHVTIH